MTDHADLIRRLEEAEAGSPVLDMDISMALDKWWMDFADQGVAGPWTQSIDGAVALVERVLGEKNALHLMADMLSYEAATTDFDLASLRDLPRLLCIALLRALQSKGEG